MPSILPSWRNTQGSSHLQTQKPGHAGTWLKKLRSRKYRLTTGFIHGVGAGSSINRLEEIGTENKGIINAFAPQDAGHVYRVSREELMAGSGRH